MPVCNLQIVLCPGGSAKAAPKSSIWDFFLFYLVRKRSLRLQKHGRWEAFKKSWKGFIPRRESAKVAPKWFICDLFPFHLVSKLCLVFRKHKLWEAFKKRFWSPWGKLRKQLRSGPFEMSFHFIWLRNVIEGFTNLDRWELFEVLEMFYPPEGSAKADPKCPVEKSFHHIGLGNGTGVIKNTSSERNFWNLENVSYDKMGWDGMGLDGVSNQSFDFLYNLYLYR